MIALITDICASVTPIRLKSTNTDEAIREIVSEHSNVLNKCGLPDEWLTEYALKDLDDHVHVNIFTSSQGFHSVTRNLDDHVPEWHVNIRLYQWWACFSLYESDDEIVTAYILDSSKAQSSHTGLFFSPCGEHLAFDYTETSDDSLRLAVYDTICKGLVDFNDDTHDAYSPEWVMDNKHVMPEITEIMDGLLYCEWWNDRCCVDFSQLRLYIFENRK